MYLQLEAKGKALKHAREKIEHLKKENENISDERDLAKKERDAALNQIAKLQDISIPKRIPRLGRARGRGRGRGKKMKLYRDIDNEK